MKPFRAGLYVAAFLAVLTLAEYYFAIHIDDATVRFAGLALTAVGKCGLIMYFFMHIDRIWRAEAH